MEEAELLKICVGSFIFGLNLTPSKVAISLWYQPSILALKPPNTTIRNGLLFEKCSKLSSKILMKFSNSSLVSPGDQ